MKQNQKQNMVAAIQKNLKIMQQQAQSYIDKHHTNLPPLCSARHYLFHSLSKRNTIEVMPSQRRTCEDSSQKKKQNLSLKTTVYNVEFKKKIKEESFRYQNNSKSLLNSTSMRMKINGGWRPSQKYQCKSTIYRDRSDDKMKTITMNSQLVDLANQDLTSNYNSFSPKLGKVDLSKKQTQMLTRYLNRFHRVPNPSTEDETKPKKKPRKSKKSKSKLQRIPYETKQVTSQELSTNMESIKKRSSRKPSFLDLQMQNPQQQLILNKIKPSKVQKTKEPSKKINTFKPKQKIEILEYTPWASIQHNSIDDFIGSAIF